MSLAESNYLEPVTVNVRDQLLVYEEKVQRALDLAEDIHVDDKGSAKTAMDFAIEARKMLKSIEAKRLEITGPSRAFVSEINSIAKGYTTRLEQVSDTIQHKIDLWKEDMRLNHKDESFFCEELGEDFAIDTLPDVSTLRTSGCTAYERTVWKFEILDYKEVPIDFLEVNESSVKLAIKNGVRNIPGLRIYSETKTSLRSM